MLLFFQKKNIQSAVCLGWAAFVFVLHVMRVDIKEDDIHLFPHSDKVVHFTMFFILTALFSIAVSAKSAAEIPFKQLLFILLCCIAYGAVLELLQGTIWVGRDKDVFDWFADVVGSICGLLVTRKFFNQNPDIRQRSDKKR